MLDRKHLEDAILIVLLTLILIVFNMVIINMQMEDICYLAFLLFSLIWFMYLKRQG